MAKIKIELITIDEKRYGEEIRMAIHDALKKLNDQLEAKKRGSDNG